VLIGDDEDHGAADGMTHLAYAKALAAAIPGARLVTLAGQGHYYYFSDPEGMNGAIRAFLAT
jgi:pimeloyl-ACP methyl ester carboxylesterase